MEKTNKIIESITAQIESSISGFNGTMPQVQKKIYDRVTLLMKDLVIKDGKLVNTVSNIKAISKLKFDIENIILDKNYIGNVADFANSFETVTALQYSYFKALELDFTPVKVLEAIKRLENK